jgi:hypothetical protein
MERVRAKNRLKRAKHAAANRAHMTYAAEEYMDNPRRKGAKRGSKSRSAQSNAARAMSLFRSGEADSLSEAWAMVKRGA